MDDRSGMVGPHRAGDGIQLPLLFGAGFFIGPLLIACAALLRLLEWAGLGYETALTGQTREDVEVETALPLLSL